MKSRRRGRLGAAAVAAGLVTLLLHPVPASADSPSCPSGYVCTWTGTNFTGDRKEFDARNTETAFDLGDHSHLVRSWANASQSHWWLADAVEGTEYLPLQCLPPGGSTANVLTLISSRVDSLFRLDTCVL